MVSGTLLFHGFSMEALSRLCREYGEVFVIHAGTTPVIVLSSLRAVREAFVNKAHSFSGRDDGWVTCRLNPTKTGIAASDYTPTFRQTKSTALGILRNIDFGKSAMETKIHSELESLVRNMKSTNGSPFNPNAMLLIAESNVIFDLLCGETHGYHDDTARTLTNAIADLFHADATIVQFFSFMRFVPKIAKEIRTMVHSHAIIMDVVRCKIAQHLEESGGNPDTDLIHGFIDKHTHSDNGGTELNLENLTFTIGDILMAGLESSNSSMNWLLLLLANHPEVQRKAYEQIEHVVGRDEAIRKADKGKLSYTEAVVWEAQRFKSVVPFGLPHRAEREDTVAGYTVPKGALLFANLSHIHMDEDIWGDPHVFRPERFLDQSGGFTRPAHVIPFSVGKRSCLGEVLARQTLFLFTATLIQKFHFRPPEGVHRICEDGHLGFTYSPKPFSVRAISRSSNQSN